MQISMKKRKKEKKLKTPIDSFPVLEMFMIPQLWRERKKQRQR